MASVAACILTGAIATAYLSLCAPRAHSEPPVSTAIVGATIVDPITGGVKADQTVLIEHDRIAMVGNSADVDVDARAVVVDAHGKWVVPGLVDAHVHFFQSGGPYTRPDVIDWRNLLPYTEEVRRTQSRIPTTLRRWLASGVTAVADLGGPMWTFDVRDMARRQDAAPHVAVAGPLISTIAVDELDIGDPSIVRAESPAHAAALARKWLERDPDFLKFWFVHTPGEDIESQAELVRAVADVAHEAGRRLVVHATELDVAKASLRAGADILAHSIRDSLVDETFLRLARERAAAYIPTLFVARGYDLVLSGAFSPNETEQRLGDPDINAELSQVPWRPPSMTDSSRPSRIEQQNLRRVWDAGITVAVGSDAGNIGTLHGPGYFREIEMLAESGLSPAEILRAATTNGAQVMGLANTIGAVASGRMADLVILDADPRIDARNLARVHRVVRAGKIFEPARILR